MSAALEVSNLVVAHRVRGRRGGPVLAVDDVSMRVEPGTVHALVGESGSGKTSFARGVLRLIEPTSGSIVVQGADFRAPRGKALRAARRAIQLVPQDPLDALDPRRTVADAIAEPWRIHRIHTHAEIPGRVAALLARVGLGAELASRYPHQLSGGQRQRVCIARALAPAPAVVILDEPFAALDPPVAAQVLDTIDDLRAQRATAFVLISHDLAVVESVADDVTVMADGRCVEQGPAADVFMDATSPVTRTLLAARIPHDPAVARTWRPAVTAADPVVGPD